MSNDGSTPVVKTAKTPTLDETPTGGGSTGKGGEKVRKKWNEEYKQSFR